MVAVRRPRAASRSCWRIGSRTSASIPVMRSTVAPAATGGDWLPAVAVMRSRSYGLAGRPDAEDRAGLVHGGRPAAGGLGHRPGLRDQLAVRSSQVAVGQI